MQIGSDLFSQFSLTYSQSQHCIMEGDATLSYEGSPLYKGRINIQEIPGGFQLEDSTSVAGTAYNHLLTYPHQMSQETGILEDDPGLPIHSDGS